MSIKTVPINDFGDGMAQDYRNGAASQFAFSRHFDILSFPRRLQPLRGMSQDVTTSGITNLMVASDGFMYGLGWQAALHSTSNVWQRCNGTIGAGGYGSGDLYKEMTNGSGGGVPLSTSPLFLEFKNVGDTRTIVAADAAGIFRVDPANVDAKINNTLAFTTIGQGFLHPKDQKVYIPYVNTAISSAWQIGIMAAAIGSGGVSTAVFPLPKQYQIYCLTNYANYLAIPCTTVSGGNNTPYNSVVYLWDRDTSNLLPNESIPWGGDLRVLNNLNGTLIGISRRSSGTSATNQDSDAIEIKGYSGGTDPFPIHIIVQNTLSTGSISMAINPNVNFIKNNRLYFSVDIVPNDGSPGRYGIWSVGKNANGRWSVTMERTVNNSDSQLSVLAAAIQGDFCSAVYTVAGTVYSSTFGIPSGTTYGATSIYESCVNPNMTELDLSKDKKLMGIYINCQPLIGNIVVKYKVDDNTAGGNFLTVATLSTTGATNFELPTLSDGTNFTDGQFYEFQLSSTGGTVIEEWGYKYMTKAGALGR